jgi:hypothetical protein
MKYLVCENANPLIHVSSGQLLKQENFIHERRNLDTFVLIVCVKGTLHIVQDEWRYNIRENQFLILFAGHEHYGYQASSEPLSYYWCHFRIQENKFRIITDEDLTKDLAVNFMHTDFHSGDEDRVMCVGGVQVEWGGGDHRKW